jgi:predicted Holliday junction resolvase-like endonuclease
MLETLLVFAVAILLGYNVFQFFNNKNLKNQLQDYSESFARTEMLIRESADKDSLLRVGEVALQGAKSEILSLSSQVAFQEEQYGKLFNQKKSSEVRTGKIAEQIAPFLSDYPFDPKSSKFIGDPIDLIVFSSDKITFVEVKSGKSQLSKKQREIRDMIKEGKVDFFIYRVKGE